MALLWPIGFAIVVWWASTGLIVYLDHLPRRTFRASLAAASLIALLALWGAAKSSGSTSPASAYCGFLCGVTLWGWQEISFYMGLVTGPRRTGWTDPQRGWAHFRAAIATMSHHEIAIGLGALLLAVLTWSGPNHVALETYLALWGLQLSARLNLYLGVRNLGESFLPSNLAYLVSFMARRRFNPLLPCSVAIGLYYARRLFLDACAADASAFQTLSASFLGAIVALAVLEHVMLVLPIPSEVLWRWGMGGKEPPLKRYAAVAVD